METKEVNLKKYIPSEGKALKIVHKNQFVHLYSITPSIVDEDELAEPVKEVEFEEYEDWVRNSGMTAVNSTGEHNHIKN